MRLVWWDNILKALLKDIEVEMTNTLLVYHVSEKVEGVYFNEKNEIIV
jgi:hypothetical protein